MTERAENITCPDDFEPEDIEFARHLVGDGAFVTQMLTVVQWMTPEGEDRWDLYVATEQGPLVSGNIGLLELAKLDLICRSDTGLPISANADDD